VVINGLVLPADSAENPKKQKKTEGFDPVARIHNKGNMILRLFPTQEEKWIQRAREGDIHALGQLYEKHFEPLYNFVFYRAGKNREIAEDITQHVFLTMVKNINGFSESKGSLYNWLCGIARHRIVDAFRFQQKHVPLDENSADDGEEIDATISRMEQQ
jgi:DNA-directed RNA polymerase specialized sigma24 family protein